MQKVPIFYKIIFMALLFYLSQFFFSTPYSFGQETENASLPIGKLTLDEAKKNAIKNNPGIKSFLARIEIATARLKQTRSSWWPTIDVGCNYGFNRASIQPDWQPATRFRDSYQEFNGKIAGQWLVFDGFARQARILAARYQQERSRQDHSEVRRLLLQAVATAFYQAQLAVEKMTIAQQDQTFNRRLEDDARKRWQVGSSPEAEMLNFSVKALTAEADFIESRRTFLVAFVLLAELMDIDQANICEESYPVQATKGKLSQYPLDFNSEIEYAMQNRPDLLALQQNELALEQKTIYEKGSFYPRLTLNAGIDYLKQMNISTVDQEERYQYALLAANWRLFDGGLRKARISEARAETEAIRQQQEAKTATIKSGLKETINNAEMAYLTFEKQFKIYELSRKIRDHVEKSYLVGAENLTRLNEAQTDFIKAKGAMVGSRIQYILSIEYIHAETGRILF